MIYYLANYSERRIDPHCWMPVLGKRVDCASPDVWVATPEEGQLVVGVGCEGVHLEMVLALEHPEDLGVQAPVAHLLVLGESICPSIQLPGDVEGSDVDLVEFGPVVDCPEPRGHPGA